ncbi:glycosyltransferase family 2 protein [Sutcliffiella horikoshii]|uniref:Glycosyltransferase family 2 protein n=1 Tax=Sutcliffiella horikoshii TaxID=79883 RepID=A0A5D4T273_9BACI|nr:glycosyltransferase family 2 protein [Sutcliffiella horikoshii]TYS69703.1 glycosyltransferase family 2 protein [Sutcliffiella horikoshii]
MSDKNLVTVLTPTFNRAYKLPDLLNSLLSQTNFNFDWLIVDDGSTDDTKEIVKKFKNDNFKITYIQKENGGKHTAHNEGIKQIDTELTMIVDSDDILKSDAIQSIYNEWIPVRNKGLCGVSFLKGDKVGGISGLKFPEDKFIGNFIDVRINRNDISEKAEVWVTDVLKKYPFPVYKGENYVGEGSIWCMIAKEKDMLFVNKVIYIYEYEEGGLTRAGKSLRVKNPLGGMFGAKVTLSKEFNWRMKTKKMWLFICYGFFAKMRIKDMFKECPMKVYFIINIPFGFFLYLYWKSKYLNK